ncbi:ATP-binding protein [Streptosporangium sp. KLBMP 9127]|nr:ATP-binding protein [Streptosporangium sp. KLBMP 9127]
MIFGSLDLLDALLGWLTAKSGDALARSTGRRILGGGQERAFRRIVNSAIEKAVDTAGEGLTTGQRKEVAKIIREHRAEIGDGTDFLEVGDLVHALIDTTTELDAFPLDRSQLADALTFWITDGVARDAMAGGELAPFAAYAHFSRIFELSARSVAALTRLEPMLGRIDETLALLRAIEEHARGPGHSPSGFGTLIAERSRHFVGRTQFITRIDHALAGLDSGYVIITGEPGIGKTSLLAYLVAQRGYIHHFNSRSEGTTSPVEFYVGVCAQLVARHGLSHALLTETPSSAHLSRVLRLAAASADEENPLVIAIDALDEAEDPEHGGNRLHLPRVLPPHTYVIATSRELADDFLVVDHRHDLHLADDSAENLHDIAQYVRARLSTPGEPVPWQTTPAELAEILTLHSEGNFLYVVHVLDDIRTGKLSPEALGDPRNLPIGLRAYYRMHWQVMKDRWPSTLAGHYETALRCLAVMREPVPIGSWTNFTPDGVDETIARHVVGEWRQFLNVRWSAEHQEPLYSVYHSTFVDFLREEGPGLSRYERHVYQVQRSMILELLGETDPVPPPYP